MLHGREEELRAVGQLVADARLGRGGALVVRGEAGVGKTALLRQAAAETGPGLRVVMCSGVQAEISVAFGGLHQLLAPLLDRLPELPDEQAAALRSALGLSAAPTRDLLIRTATLSLLQRVAGDTPLLVVVDDLQWLDRDSAGVLLFAARRLDRLSVGFLAAVREADAAVQEADSDRPDGSNRPDAEGPSAPDTRDLPRLTLRGLTVDAASALLDERGWGAASGSARRSVVAAVGGNPLALEELVRLGPSPEVAENLALTGTAPLGRRLRAVYAERTRKLPEPVRTLLLVAAADVGGRTDVVLGAAGRLAHLDTAERVEQAAHPGTAEEGEQATYLDAAEQAGHLEVSGPQLRFLHPLVRAAVYADASARQRALAHRALAAELAQRHEPVLAEQAIRHRALAATGP
ncbi:AAA family ATPase, partial [Streptomyces sp. E11-3]|uniref:AAA family ATPase n=1 Tax=Streptomyces sp. E11-3 TaxID=3110112 RepID=UPI0039810AB7